MISYIIFVVFVTHSFIQFGCSITLTDHDPANLRLMNGADRCQGLVQFHDTLSNTFLQACNSLTGDDDIEVVCRQLGCNTANAKKVNSTRFGYTGAEYFTLFNYECTGNEQTLSSCTTPGSIDCATSDLFSAVAADCSGTIAVGGGSNEASRIRYLLIIIAGSIVGGIILIVFVIDIALIICCARKRRREAGLDLYIY